MICKTICQTTQRASLLAFLLAALGAAGTAEARQETLRWTHSQGSEVAAFHIVVGTAPGASDLLSQAIGVPAADGNGVYSYTVDVDSEDTIYVRMTAVNSGSVHSSASNEISRSVPLGMPGVPIVVIP
jgi:hypothetical protein